MSRICLNMIVKNEAANIERCLRSVAPYISMAIILDTGSSDGTKEIIENFCAARRIPVQVYDGTFKNFEQARNDALTHARPSMLEYDYLLLIDADMELIVHGKRALNNLSQPSYGCVQKTSDGVSYYNTRLLRRETPAKYVGVTHEYLQMVPSDSVPLTEISMIDHVDGANRSNKGERDLRLLQEALKEDPANPRNVLYVAQVYGSMNCYHDARRWFRKRAKLGGWDEEVYYCLFQIASISHKLGSANTEEHYLKAYRYRPTRTEPLIGLALYHREQGNYAMAILYARAAYDLPMTTDKLFKDEACYTWRPMDEILVCACHVNAWEEGRKMADQLLASPHLPASERARVEANAAVYRNVRAAPMRAVA